MITLSRVDERLIHGQVVAAWITSYKIAKIVIVDDGVAGNQMLIRINQGMLPKTTSLDVVTVSDAYKFITENIVSSSENTLLLAKTPGPFAMLEEKGLHLDKVIIGNMINGAGRKKIDKNFYATAEEVEHIKIMLNKDCEVIYQLTPDSAAKKLKSLI